MTENGVNDWLGHWVSRQENGRRALTLCQPLKSVPNDGDLGKPSQQRSNNKGNTGRNEQNRPDTVNQRRGGSGTSQTAVGVSRQTRKRASTAGNVGKNTESAEDLQNASASADEVDNHPVAPRARGGTVESRRTFLAELSDDGKYHRLLALLDIAGVSVQYCHSIHV